MKKDKNSKTNTLSLLMEKYKRFPIKWIQREINANKETKKIIYNKQIKCNWSKQTHKHAHTHTHTQNRSMY